MIVILFALTVTFAAFAIWLTVRIINRRERWARRLAVAVVVLAMYPMSMGPACWLVSWTDGTGGAILRIVYSPITRCLSTDWKIVSDIVWYSDFGAASGWRWLGFREGRRIEWKWLSLEQLVPPRNSSDAQRGQVNY